MNLSTRSTIFRILFFFMLLEGQTISANKKENIHIFKLGGGLITEKDKDHGVARIKVIQQIAKETAAFLKSHPTHKLIIVNGAGSFAHPIVKKYKLHKQLTPKNIHGVVETHIGAAEIAQILVNEFNKAGVKALPIHPMSFAVCENKKITRMDTDAIQIMLDHGFVPVIHGDIVMDLYLGVCILSGDQIGPFLAHALKIPTMGHASCENGVYDCNGKTITVINQNNINVFKKNIGASEHADVTGGMFKKVEELLTFDAPETSYIFNGAKKGSITAFLEGKNLGTKIVNEHPKK